MLKKIGFETVIGSPPEDGKLVAEIREIECVPGSLK